MGLDGTRWKWVERYTRAFDSVRFTDRGQFLADLVDASLQMSRSGRGYGILMDKDEVIAEVGLTNAGDPWTAEDHIRKTAAKSKLRAAVRSPDPGEASRTPIEVMEGCLTLPFVMRGDLGGAIVLCGVAEGEDGDRDVGLTAALILGICRSFDAREQQVVAIDRAAMAEIRQLEIEKAASSGGVGAVAFLKPVAELERDAIELALRSTGWNKEEAARRLGISRASIYMKVKKFGLQRPPAD